MYGLSIRWSNPLYHPATGCRCPPVAFSVFLWYFLIHINTPTECVQNRECAGAQCAKLRILDFAWVWYTHLQYSLTVFVMNSIDNNTKLLIKAAEMGKTSELQRLLPISDPKAHDSLALRWAAKHGHIECVHILIPASNPLSMHSQALRNAAEGGFSDCVAALIPVSDPKDNDSEALRWAADERHVECVRLLIPVSNPKDRDSEALQWAARSGAHECVDLLIDVSDVAVAINNLYIHAPNDYDRWGFLAQRWDAEQQNTILREHAGTASKFSAARKI